MQLESRRFSLETVHKYFYLVGGNFTVFIIVRYFFLLNFSEKLHYLFTYCVTHIYSIALLSLICWYRFINMTIRAKWVALVCSFKLRLTKITTGHRRPAAIFKEKFFSCFFRFSGELFQRLLSSSYFSLPLLWDFCFYLFPFLLL